MKLNKIYNEDYYRQANDRLEAHKAQLSLILEVAK